MKWWGWVMLAAGLLAAGGAAVYEGLGWKYVRRAQERIEALPTEEAAGASCTSNSQCPSGQWGVPHRLRGTAVR